MTSTDGTGADPLVTETVDRLLASSSTPEVIDRAEDAGWCAEVWDPLAELGFPWISVPEAAGGSGGSLVDAFEVVRAVGRHAAPVPVAETALLGGWLAGAVGWDVAGRVLTVVPRSEALTLEGGQVRGRAVVPWAHRADAVLAVLDGPDGTRVASARPEQLRIERRANMAGEPRDVVTFELPLAEMQTAPGPDGLDGAALLGRGCLARVVLAAGALEAVSQLTIAYTSERQQFGKPIATFQAVQQHMVTVAQADVRASMSAQVAIRAAARDPRAVFEIAAARVVVDQAIVEATRASHQAHGAMGLAREYRLQQYTRRLWSWRSEFGSARSWSRVLGRQVAAAGADALFPGITR